MSSKPVELHSVSSDGCCRRDRGVQQVSPRHTRTRGSAGPLLQWLAVRRKLMHGIRQPFGSVHGCLEPPGCPWRACAALGTSVGAGRCMRLNCPCAAGLMRTRARTRRLPQVEGSNRTVLVGPSKEGEKGHPLVIETLKGTGEMRHGRFFCLKRPPLRPAVALLHLRIHPSPPTTPAHPRPQARTTPCSPPTSPSAPSPGPSRPAATRCARPPTTASRRSSSRWSTRRTPRCFTAPCSARVRRRRGGLKGAASVGRGQLRDALRQLAARPANGGFDVRPPTGTPLNKPARRQARPRTRWSRWRTSWAS